MAKSRPPHQVGSSGGAFQDSPAGSPVPQQDETECGSSALSVPPELSGAVEAVARCLMRGWNLVPFMKIRDELSGAGFSPDIIVAAVKFLEDAAKIERQTHHDGYKIRFTESGLRYVWSIAQTLFDQIRGANEFPEIESGKSLLSELVSGISQYVPPGLLDSIYRKVHSEKGIVAVERMHGDLMACSISPAWRRIAELTMSRRRTSGEDPSSRSAAEIQDEIARSNAAARPK